MLLPEPVDRIQDDVALQALHRRRLFVTRFALVRFLDLPNQELRVLLDRARLELGFVLGQAERESDVHPVQKSAIIWLLARRAGPEEFLHFRGNRLIDHFEDKLARLVGIDRVVAISVNDLALVVHHVVEIERPFAREVIALFDPFLRGLNRFVQPRMLELLAFLESEPLHDFRHPIGRAEVAHEIVLEADVETRTAGIALPRATAPQLPVDPARLVPLRADHEKTAVIRDAFTELNVGSAAGHVRRNRDRPGLSGALDDLRFLHVILRVQDVVRNFLAL